LGTSIFIREGRRKKEEGRRKREEGRRKNKILSSLGLTHGAPETGFFRESVVQNEVFS
jgi:hypothetical protein